MKKIFSILIIFLLTFTLVSCKKDKQSKYDNDIYYSLFVRSFADSDGDGIGDLKGVTENLDYLEELGVTGVWLLPIFESPSYHGYDTTDYYKINPDYGTMEDLDELLKKANKKGIKIILDLVINHTSDQHPWFINSKSSVNSEYRDYYVWRNGTAYESFVGGMKDLNLDNPKVVEEIEKIAKYYLDKGVSGFRLDAVGHLFEESGAHLAQAKNTLFMSSFNDYVKSVKEDAFVVGEVYINDYNILNGYVTSGASYFNFYLQNQLKDKIAEGNNRTLLVSNIIKNYNKYYSNKNDYVDSVFISNHDMDRAANMYRDEVKLRKSIEFMMTLPGNSFIYYGDELGMKGVRYEGETIGGKVVYDEYRRQPFIWGDDRNTTWLASDGSNNNTNNYLIQREDPNSLFNLYKELISLRKENPALMDGLEIYEYKIKDLESYIRVINNGKYKQALLVTHNLYDKTVEIDLDLKVIYGSKVVEGNSMSIFEIPFDSLAGYL